MCIGTGCCVCIGTGCCVCIGRIRSSESIMFYSSGSGSSASYQKPGFVPMFVAQFKSSAVQQTAQVVCGTSSQCLLDYAVTGNAHFANTTLNIGRTVGATNELFSK